MRAIFANVGQPLTWGRAMSYALTNQLATPGLGTLLAGRYVVGALQLALTVTGCGFLLVWFFRVIVDYYGLIGDRASSPTAHGWIGWVGLGLFTVGWLWALVSSIGFCREAARRREQELNQKPAVPPQLPPRDLQSKRRDHV